MSFDSSATGAVGMPAPVDLEGDSPPSPVPDEDGETVACEVPFATMLGFSSSKRTYAFHSCHHLLHRTHQTCLVN